MPFTDLFSEHSALYASIRPKYPEELFAYLASLSSKRDRAWDCATGNGQAAIGLAHHFREVQATDASPQQIEHASQAENITYSVQHAEQTNFANEYFDLVTVAQALHWLDHDRFFVEVRRVLRPGAIFAAWGYNWFHVSPEIDALVQKKLLPLIAPFWLSQNGHLWNSFRDIAFPFERIESPKFFLRPTWTAEQFLAYIHTWSATRRCVGEKGPEYLGAASEEISLAWGETLREVRMDVPMFVGRNSASWNSARVK